MFFPRRFNKLGENEIAGAETINPIIDLICGLRCDSDFLDINANGVGGVTFSLNEGVLYNWLAKALQRDSLDHSFKGTISGGEISVSGGTVYLMDNAVSISSMGTTTCRSGDYVCAVLSSQSSGQLSYLGSIGGGCVQPAGNGHGNRMVLPILQTIKHGDEWEVKYLHIGDFHFVTLPYFWIPGYDKTKKQSLDHDENTDGYVWTEYGECEEEE